MDGDKEEVPCCDRATTADVSKVPVGLSQVVFQVDGATSQKWCGRIKGPNMKLLVGGDFLVGKARVLQCNLPTEPLRLE